MAFKRAASQIACLVLMLVFNVRRASVVRVRPCPHVPLSRSRLVVLLYSVYVHHMW